MPRVVISAKSFVTPPICVCCGGEPNVEIADQGENRSGGQSRLLSFPACSRCAQHHAYDAQRTGVGGDFDPHAHAPVRLPTCEAPGRLFDFVEWYGTQHTVLFASSRYAHAFVEANRAEGKKVLSFDLGSDHLPTWSSVAGMAAPRQQVATPGPASALPAVWSPPPTAPAAVPKTNPSPAIRAAVIALLVLGAVALLAAATSGDHKRTQGRGYGRPDGTYGSPRPRRW